MGGLPDSGLPDAMSDAIADGTTMDAGSDAGLSDAAASDAAAPDAASSDAATPDAAMSGTPDASMADEPAEAGRAMAALLAPAGQLYCWGGGSDRATREQISVGDVVEVSVGQPSCLLRVDGSVECWGENSAGELGDGTTRNRTVSGAVTGLDGAVAVRVARFTGAESEGGARNPGFACAVHLDGSVECWGSNAFGQLGDGTTTDRSERTEVLGLGDGIVQLSLGARHACAVTSAGGAVCWGDNARGQLGDLTTQPRQRPTAVAGLSAGVLAIEAGAAHTCALLEGGAVACWGADDRSQLGDGIPGRDEREPQVITDLVGATSLAAGASHTCVIAGGGVLCWGDNSSTQLGQLDNGEPVKRPTGLGRVNALPGTLVELALGADHTCAVTQDADGRRVYCWGANAAGQLGNGLRDDRREPQLVRGLPAP